MRLSTCARCYLPFRLLIACTLLFTLTNRVDSQERFDVVIKGGRIIDGTGAPWYRGDVAIRDGKIAAIGEIDISNATNVIDANELIVAPGFVDMMGQSATPLLRDSNAAINLLSQGITTINAGEGASAAPLNEEQGARQGWTTMAEYFQLLESKGLPINVAQTIGHTQVRRIVIGDVDRRASDQELEQMQDLVREAMEAGAIGVSTALIYPPAVYAPKEEIAALAAVAGEYGGRYYTHMRNEGDLLLEAIDEAISIGDIANTPVHIFHLKAAGQQNWGKMQEAIARIKASRVEGKQITADIYPYINNGLGIAAFIHPRHFRDGFDEFILGLDDERKQIIRDEMEQTDGWENWFRHVGHDWDRVVIGYAADRRYAEHQGSTIAEIAEACGEDPWTTFFQLVRTGAFALPQSMSEANKIMAMQQEFVSFCTDVGPVGDVGSSSHPRGFGSFPRLISRYVRDLGAISLERAIAQASASGANNLLAFDRGRIAVGCAADIIVFDYDKLTDRATFASPHDLSEGMRHVFVNGQLVFDEGELTRRRPGRILRGPGFRISGANQVISSGRIVPELASFDQLATNFIARHRVPGLSIAVTHEGRLVYARGHGMADVGLREPVTPDSLFRIASISKPITAVAILQLVEKGLLTLDTPILDVLGIEEAIQASDSFDERWRLITIEHLLQHRGGWDRGVSFDAMFQSVRFANQVGVEPPAAPDAVIQAMLNVPLDFDPGERYAYSNFGYCLLGRAIEALTDMEYDEYVKQFVLAPVGIHSMKLGGTRLSDRATNEVRYYDPYLGGTSVFASDLDQQTPAPYGNWYLEAMDAHGGWIASAVDLARFATAFDEPSQSPLLSHDSCALMFERPPGRAGFDQEGNPTETYYGLGWLVRPVGRERSNQWHTGSLPGTAAILIRRHDGLNFIALINCRVSPESNHLGRTIDSLLHQAANQVETWPTIDLFDEHRRGD